MGKNSIKILIVISLLIVFMLIGILVYVAINRGNVFNFDFGSSVEKIEENIVKDKAIDVANIKNININFSSSDINFILTDNKELRIVQYANRKLKNNKLFESNVANDSLTINEEKNSFFNFINIGSNSSTYDIYLPKTYVSDIDIDATSSDIFTEGELNLDNLKVQLISGNLIINNKIKTNTNSIKSVSGNVKINNVDSNNSTITTTSGEISIGGINNNSEIKSVSGDIKVDNVEGKVIFQTTSGEITIDEFNILDESEIKTVSGDVDVSLNSNAKCELDIHTISGEITLPKKSYVVGTEPYNKLNIKTTSGDIQVGIK